MTMARLTRKIGTERVASIFLLTPRCIPVKGSISSRSSTASTPGATLRAGLGAFFSPVAIMTSSAVTRPNSPVPTMLAKSILAFLASARAVGVAAITPAAGMCAGFTGAETAAAFVEEPAAEAAGFLEADMTSPPVIRPLGPVPTTVLRSTPNSSAFFLASGDATMRPPALAFAFEEAVFGAAAAAAFGEAAAAAGMATAAPAPPASVAA
mmetsp:Transcript_6014/g.8756  ORF Transcript_6014/g.8756 Transcript_6014/m.8756 type:complete len:210 (+) Transcript_6014:1001-1630(+)